jgi:hypothetical protein
MVITQELAEASSAATEVGSDGQLVGTESRGDVPDREVRVVEEDHCRALAIGQASQRHDEVRIAIPIEVPGLDRRRPRPIDVR